MANITLEDTKGIVEVVVFPDLYSKHLLVIRSDKPLVVAGSLERTEDGTTRIRAKNITPLQEIRDKLQSVVRIKIDCSVFHEGLFAEAAGHPREYKRGFASLS